MANRRCSIMVRVCKNCGVAGHNIRTCTQPMKPQAPPSPPKKRGRPKGSKNKPKTVPSPAPTPTLAPAKEESVIVEPQAVAMPTSMPTTQKMVNGVDVSGMEVINKDGVTQYKTKKGTFIIFPEVNITRNETFLNVVRRVKEVVADRNRDGMKLVFKVKELRRDESAITNPSVLRAAQRGLISGSYERPIGSGNYYWETVIYQIEHSEFEDPKFEFIGTIEMRTDDAGAKYGDWDFTAKFYPRHATDSPKALGGSKAYQEYDPLPQKLYFELLPQIKEMQETFMEHSNAMGKEKFPTGQDFGVGGTSKKRFKGSCHCYKCNPKGDKMWRQSADIYLTKEEIKGYKVGRLGSEGSFVDIPKGTLIPLGDGCEYSVNPIDIELISSLYGTSRRISKSQNMWQNPYSIMGWGFAVMDIRSYLTRVFSFYNKKLDTAMKLIESKGKLPFLIPDSTVLQGGITYKSLNPYALDQYAKTKPGYSSSNYRSQEAYNKLRDSVSDKLFPRTATQKRAGSKGVFDNKSSFLLEARYFEDKGVYWLQPARAKDGGIEDFIEAYDLQKDDPEFFISVMQPVYNEDGMPIIDENGTPLEEIVMLPNPEKLKELYALSGGIKEVYSPDDVKQDVEDAIAFLEGLDVANLPPILEKYFEAYQITNPLVEVNNHSGVTKEKNSHKDASSIWSIYNIYKLEEKRKKAYDEYLRKALERKEQRSGMTLSMDFLDEKEQKIWESIQYNLSTWDMRNSYITDVISSDDLDFVKETQKNVQHLYNREGKEVPVIFYTMPVDWNKLEELATIAKNAAKANKKLKSDARNLDSDILQIYRDGGGYYRTWQKPTPRTLDTQGEVYTNKEVFDLAGIDFNYTDEEVVKMDESYGFSYAFFNSQGLVTRLLLNYDQLDTIKKYYEAKYMANLGVGQAPTAPTTPAPAPSASKNYSSSINSSKMGQLEREVKTTKFPLDNGEDVKGYVVAVSAKTYNRPFPKKTKYVGVITANNNDDSLNGHYLNFPFNEDEINPNGIYKGNAVILDFKTGNGQDFYGRYQTSISKVNMRRD